MPTRLHSGQKLTLCLTMLSFVHEVQDNRMLRLSPTMPGTESIFSPRILHLTAVSLLALCTTTFHAQQASELQVVQSIPLPNVRGRIDHMGIDRSGRRLFIAAVGNGTVEVIDLATGRSVHSIGGLEEPQGVLYVPGTNTLFVACGGDGTVRLYDGATLRLKQTIPLDDDADNIRYDEAGNIVYAGFGSGGIAAIDARNGKLLYTIPLAGHPESFQLDHRTGRLFVNIPTRREVAVVSLEKRAVIYAINLAGMGGNFPMSFDNKNHRLYVGCRTPAQLLVFDTDSLKQIASIPISGDADDIFSNNASVCLYLSCGEGFIDVVRKDQGGQYKLAARIPTSPGARTSLFVTDLRCLFVAVPASGIQPAQIRSYAVQIR